MRIDEIVKYDDAEPEKMTCEERYKAFVDRLIEEIRERVPTALRNGQNVTYDLRVGDYAEVREDGWNYPVSDGSMVLLLTIGPLHPSKHVRSILDSPMPRKEKR